MEYIDHYATLGLDRYASSADVKKAYRSLVKKHHPDVATGASDTAKATAINEAYAVLSDADARRTYDMTHAFAGARGGGRGPSWASPEAAAASRAAHAEWKQAADEAAADRAKGWAETQSQAGGFDWEEWNRMHFGPSEEEKRAYFYEQWADARGRGFKGPWEDPSLNDRTNFYARRKASQAFAARGLSETEHYREYAARFRAARTMRDTKWPAAVAFWGVVGAGAWLAATRLNNT